MKTKRITIALFFASMLLLPCLLWAQGTIEVKSRAEMEVIKTNEDGEKVTVMIPAEKVIPGETVIYTNTITNIGEVPAEDVTINNPVPEYTDYLAGSAFGEAVTVFSADEGENFAPEGEVKVIDENGKSRPALAKEYTNIRWTMNSAIQPGESVEVGFRVRLQ